jgi:hypothetical protein
MKYGTIFGGNSSNSKLMFALQKRAAGIMAGVNTRNSSTSPFTRLDNLPLPYKYIFSLMNFVVDSREYFLLTNSAIHSVNPRNGDYLHKPTANFSCYQKS